MDLDYSDCPIIKGSAIKALEDPEGPWGDGVLELIETVGEITSLPDKAFDQPFLMPIWRIYEKAGLAEGSILVKNEKGSKEVACGKDCVVKFTFAKGKLKNVDYSALVQYNLANSLKIEKPAEYHFE